MSVNDIISQLGRYLRRYNDVDVTQNCGLTVGTTTSKLKTANAIVYTLYNNQVSLAATDNITMTACTQQAISTTCYYLVSASSAGAITVTKGTDNAYALPSVPAGTVAIGAFLITTDSSHTFTSGTTTFNATGITVAFYDIDVGIASFLINQAMRRLERGVTIVRNGHQFIVADFDYMTVRAQETISQGDDTVTLPFTGYKDFQDGGINITDSTGVTYPLEKMDVVPLGVVFQTRPTMISRLPTIETVFTPDGSPAKTFNIWPESDDTYTIDTIAYQYSPTLDGVLYSSNWLTDNAPDVLLFGALVEAVGYFPADQRMAEWKDRYNESVWTLYAAQERERYSGTPISTRFPNPLRMANTLGMASNRAGIYSYGFLDTTQGGNQ